MPNPDGAYTVAVKPWSGGLELHVADVGVTQAHNLDDADDMARDLIERRTGQDRWAITVEWDFTAVIPAATELQPSAQPQ